MFQPSTAQKESKIPSPAQGSCEDFPWPRLINSSGISPIDTNTLAQGLAEDFIRPYFSDTIQTLSKLQDHSERPRTVLRGNQHNTIASLSDKGEGGQKEMVTARSEAGSLLGATHMSKWPRFLEDSKMKMQASREKAASLPRVNFSCSSNIPSSCHYGNG